MKKLKTIGYLPTNDKGQILSNEIYATQLEAQAEANKIEQNKLVQYALEAMEVVKDIVKLNTFFRLSTRFSKYCIRLTIKKALKSLKKQVREFVSYLLVSKDLNFTF